MGNLDLTKVYHDANGTWYADMNIKFDVEPDVELNVGEVKVIEPGHQVLYSVNIKEHTSTDSTDFFDFNVRFSFDPRQISESALCVPDFVIQYDYNDPQFRSYDYHTGCDSSSPKYCFDPRDMIPECLI